MTINSQNHLFVCVLDFDMAPPMKPYSSETEYPLGTPCIMGLTVLYFHHIPIKDVLMGIQKSDLLGVTTAVIHVAVQRS